MSDMSAREAWNTKYTAQPRLYGIEPNESVVEHLADLSPRRVLDLACGQGRNAVWLATQGHTVTGLDVSDVAIEQAKALAERAGVPVDFQSIDIARQWVPDPDSFDLVVLSYVQLPESTRRVAHAKVQRALTLGGTVFLIAHHADNMTMGVGGPPMPEVHFTEADLAKDFAALTIERNEKVLREVAVADGVRHAHDVLMVATKS